jgi:hypothetical protein
VPTVRLATTLGEPEVSRVGGSHPAGWASWIEIDCRGQQHRPLELGAAGGRAVARRHPGIGSLGTIGRSMASSVKRLRANQHGCLANGEASYRDGFSSVAGLPTAIP